MKISYFCTTWGQKNGSWDAFFKKVKKAGYDGIETSLPPESEEGEFLKGLNAYQLDFIASIGRQLQLISKLTKQNTHNVLDR